MESFLPSGCFFGSGESEGLFSPAVSIHKVLLLSYQHRGISVLKDSRCWHLSPEDFQLHILVIILFLVYHHHYFLPCGHFPRLFIDEQCIWKTWFLYFIKFFFYTADWHSGFRVWIPKWPDTTVSVFFSATYMKHFSYFELLEKEAINNCLTMWKSTLLLESSSILTFWEVVWLNIIKNILL